MLAALVAFALLLAAVAGVYFLLKSMGQDGVEAAAPGSCKSGRCGVQPRQSAEASPNVTHVQIGAIKRKDALSNTEIH
ncbi:MAG: hypothetical protein WC474_05840 [Hydrogenophilaceae bacterium]